MKTDKDKYAMKIFAYSMVYDTGFAPCVSDNILTLACCKTRLRYKIGKIYSENTDENIYILGLCGSAMRKKNALSESFLYSPVYIARITNTVKTNEYFSLSENGRRDQVYYCSNEGKWSSLKNNPHVPETPFFDPYEKRNNDIFYVPNSKIQPKFNYVLISEDYVYFGDKLMKDSQLCQSVRKICLIRKNACRADLSQIILPDECYKDFIEWFKMIKGLGINGRHICRHGCK